MTTCRTVPGMVGVLAGAFLVGLFAWRPSAQTPPQPPAVFTVTVEEKATGWGDTASSKVTVRLAPAAEWHGYSFVGGEDVQTPAAFYRSRGGLLGLDEYEPMCFGILSHEGTASAGGRTINGPPPSQLNGVNWTLHEDAARFIRGKDGGEFTVAPIVYEDEDPPEFSLLAPGGYTLDAASNKQYEEMMTFHLTTEDLKNLTRVRQVHEASLTSKDGDLHQDFKITLTGDAPPDDSEVTVTVDDGFDGWKPEGNVEDPKEPGNALTFKVKVNRKGDPTIARKANLVISLADVSKNKGICGNWPKNAAAEEGLRFKEDDFPKEDGLLYRSRTEIASDVALEEADFRVHSYDYGAWGTLRITAKDEAGKVLEVTIRGRETTDLRLPLDEDRNRIADSWEPGVAFGKAKEWDEDAVQGQDAKGDGVSLYDEYRGIVAPDGQGGRAFERLSPNRKEMFVLDASGEFMTGKWEGVSGIKAIRLDDTMVDPAGNPGPGKSPLVNFNAEDRGTRGVYALKIVVRNDDEKSNQSPAYAQMAEGANWCIKNAIAVNVFPARFERRIEEDFFLLETGCRCWWPPLMAVVTGVSGGGPARHDLQPCPARSGCDGHHVDARPLCRCAAVHSARRRTLSRSRSRDEGPTRMSKSPASTT